MNSDKDEEQQQETNDNNKLSTSIQAADIVFEPAAQDEPTSQSPPVRRPRPVRPNVRRPVVMAVGEVGQSGSSVAAPSVELTTVMPNLVPPKRPAYLPARYDTYSRHHPPLGANQATKPNRYSWAQMQHWQAASQQPDSEHGLNHNFSSPFSTAASRVLVVNPMHIVNLSEHTKSRLIKSIEAVKKFSEKWFSHVLLLMFLAVYACFGAYVFISFEAPTEQWEKQLIIETRARIVNDTWDELKAKNQQQFLESLEYKLQDYERLLNKACASGLTSNSLDNQWNFWGALFYSMTVFTTIGYGHLTPITFAGRVATMVYAIFGIPILLMVLADLGKLLTRIIKYAFKKFRYLYNKLLRRKSSVRTRKMISDNTTQYIGAARDAFERGFAYIQPYSRISHTFRVNSMRRKQQRDRADIDQEESSDTAKHLKQPMTKIELTPSDPGNSIKTTDVIITPSKQTKPVSPPAGDKKSLSPMHHHQSPHHNHSRAQSPGLATMKRKSSFRSCKKGAVKGSVSRSSSSSIVAPQNGDKIKTQNSAKIQPKEPEKEQDPQVGSEAQSKVKSEPLSETSDEVPLGSQYEEMEDDFDIPVSFALFLLVTYMMFGAVVFSIWEGWNFFDSLYFVFISMSTIGFGDLVPQHPKRMIGTFIYLLFGLALTSMCINVVQEKIHATFLRAKMQIGEKMGFDLDQIMADDYYDASMGPEEDEDDSNSVAISQTNSSLAQLGPDGEVIDPEASDQPASSPIGSPIGVRNEGGLKLSKSSSSFKSSKKRYITGLPGHSGQLLRKSSKKLTRQSTPVCSTQVATNELVAPEGAAINQSSSVKEVLKTELLRQQPSINYPLNSLKSMLCEPLRKIDKTIDRTTNQQLKSNSRSQSTVAKSLSSETRPTFEPNAKLKRYNHLGRSVGSSRRSSVSHELNELDDLIMSLSQSPSERFGPLLGIPSSARSSRSNSPTSRRATSMTCRPSPSRSPCPTVKKKSSLVSQLPSHSMNESQAALDDLEALKFSAV